jgi:hypothetical protein
MALFAHFVGRAVFAPTKVTIRPVATDTQGIQSIPKSARKNRSGDVDAIFCASRGGRVVGGRYYLRPGAAGYAERGFGRCVKGRGYCLAAAKEETWRPSEEDLRKLTGG